MHKYDPDDELQKSVMYGCKDMSLKQATKHAEEVASTFLTNNPQVERVLGPEVFPPVIRKDENGNNVEYYDIHLRVRLPHADYKVIYS